MLRCVGTVGWIPSHFGVDLSDDAFIILLAD